MPSETKKVIQRVDWYKYIFRAEDCVSKNPCIKTLINITVTNRFPTCRKAKVTWTL